MYYNIWFSNELHLHFYFFFFFFYFERTSSTMVLVNEELGMFVLWKWLNGLCRAYAGEEKRLQQLLYGFGWVGWAVDGWSATDLNGFRTDKRWLGMGCARRSFRTNSTNTWYNMPREWMGIPYTYFVVVVVVTVIVDFVELTPCCWFRGPCFNQIVAIIHIAYINTFEWIVSIEGFLSHHSKVE